MCPDDTPPAAGPRADGESLPSPAVRDEDVIEPFAHLVQVELPHQAHCEPNLNHTVTADERSTEPQWCDPLAGARLRGVELKRKIFESAEVLTADAAARRLHVEPARLREMAAAGSLLALAHPSDAERVSYPEWQFEERVLDTLPVVLQAMRSLDGWEIWYFLTSADPVLQQFMPLEVMRGQTDSAEDMERLQDLLDGNHANMLLEKAARRFVDGD